MSVAPHSGIIDFGTFTSPDAPKDGIQGEVPAPLVAEIGYILSTEGWIPQSGGGGGDVNGPASATDNAITRYDGTTGKLIQNSTVTMDDNGNVDNVNAITFDILPATLPTAEGTLFWDEADSAKTLSLVMTGGNAIQQIGEEQYLRIKASGAITEGQVVMFTGSVGASGGLTGAPATGLTAVTAQYVIGVATENIALNDWGYVTSFGTVRGIDTLGGAEAWVDGEILYLDPTVIGGLTKFLPIAPNPKVIVCAVTHAATNGSLFIRGSYGGILGQFEGDVNIFAPADGQLLMRDQTDGRWVNAFLTAGTGISVNNGAGAVVIANTGVISVTGTAPVVSSGGTTPAISMAAASGSESGYLTSTDWTTFNNKQPAGAYVTSVAATSPVTSTGGTTPTIAMPAATGSVNGYLTSTDWTTFNSKQPAGSYLVTVTADSPLVGSGTSASPLSIPAATTSVSGYLTSTDWNTFNSKQPALGYTPVNQIGPVIYNDLEFYGAGVTGYTPFASTMANWVVDTNDFSLFYLQNLNNGTDASADFVVYNDASDVNSYFIDMGMNSSNYTSATYPIFTPNSSYLFSGGGTGAITSDMFIGTSTANSDVVIFAGGVAATDEVMRVKSNRNVIIGTDPDTGETFQVSGSAHIKGATEFSSTVLLSANPTTALQAATKQYVDNLVTAGLHIHEPVLVETTANLTASYVQGGTTFNITDITGGNTVTTSTVHGLAVNDQIWLYSTAGNGLSINTAYFVFSTPSTTQLTLSLTYNGAQISGLTNATGLTYATRANSGVGATLTNAGTQAALIVDGVAMSVGNRVMVRLQTNGAENGVYNVTTVGTGATNWVLTRSSDENKIDPEDPNGLGTGDYFFTTSGNINAGDSHVLTTEPNTMIIGYTPLTYTQFSGAVVYTGGTNITVTGQTINVSGTIDATLGGTGTSTVTTGDLLYGTGTNAWGKLPAGSAYKSLVMNAGGTQVEWNGIALNQANAVSGQLGISNGGTGASTAAAALTALGAYPDTNPAGYTSNTGTVTSVAALTLGTTGTDLSSTVATGTTTPVITLNVPTASAANRGVLSSADWTTFNNKQPAGAYLTAVIADSPLVGSGTAASHLSIPAATTSVNGYLTSTDWNTFNGKQATLVSGSNIKTINGATVLGSGDLVVSGSFAGGTLTSPLILAAGTATNGTEPLRFQTGIIATSPAAGTMEYDGVTLMATPQSGNRGVVPAVHYITQVANYTTPLGTANTLKQMFNATTSGSMTASANTTYFFECMFQLSSMSGTSGNFQFGLLGTATITNIMYMAIANKTALTVQTASSHTFGTVRTAVVISAANTTTTGYALIKGKIVVSTAGTIIPAYATSIAAASVVNAGAHFRIWEAGTNTEVEIGNWA